jgi:hypothetical protein
MAYGFEVEEKKSSRCLLWVILFVLLCNLVITGFLSYGLYVVATQGESEAKRISNDIVIEQFQAFRNFISNRENRTRLVKELSVIINDIAVGVAPNVTKTFTAEAAANLVPYDVFSIADYLLNYNFGPTAELLGATLHSASQSFMKIPKYQDGAQVVSAIASVVDIVATVEPLSDSTDPPATNEYSLLGQTILRLPVTIQNSLTQEVWSQAAEDCATLANRLYFTEFTGSYNTPYGPVDYNFNEQIKPVFSNIYDICLALASSPSVEQ